MTRFTYKAPALAAVLFFALAWATGSAVAQECPKVRVQVLGERSSATEIRCALVESQRAARSSGKTIVVVAEDEPVPGAAFTVNFRFGSSELTPASRRLVERIVDVILDDDELRDADFLIDGHTDAVGSAAFNMSLGAERALTVRRAFARLGIDRDAMRTRSFGESDLLDPDDPTAGINRRVEITPYL